MNEKIKALHIKHNVSMEYAYLAEWDRARGKIDEANRKYRLAYTLECEVIRLLGNTNTEPLRSVIHRSAASLAIDFGEYREAEN